MRLSYDKCFDLPLMSESIVVPSDEELLARFTGYDWGAFASMLVCSGAIGLYCAFSGGRQNTIRQLLIGSGTLPVIPVATSLMASFISAAYILGNAAEVYDYGTMGFMTFLSYCLMIPITILFYLPVFHSLGVVTAFEYLEFRFGRITRMVAVVLYVFQMLIYVSISLYAPALAVSQLTGIHVWIAVTALGIVCTVYTSIGGIKAVVYTDTFQTVFMMVALITVLIAGNYRLGGIAEVWRLCQEGLRLKFDDFSTDVTVRHTIWGVTIGGLITNLASYSTNQMMIVRYMTVSSLNKARWVVGLNLPYLVLTLLLSSLCGLMVFARYRACDPLELKKISTSDQLLPYLVMDLLGDMTPVPGIFVGGIFAASLSSVSSGVNALASVFYVDIIALIKEDIPDAKGAKYINYLGVLFGLLSIALVAIAMNLGDVLTASTFVNGAIGGPLLGLFTMGMLLPQVNTTGALWGLFVSFGISLWINIGTFLNGPAAPALPVSTKGCVFNLTNVTTSLYAGEEESLGIYSVSYLWFSCISFVIVFIVGMPVSLVTGSLDVSQLDPRLIRHPADVLLFWMHPLKREKFKFQVGENYAEGDVFETKASVSSMRLHSVNTGSRKPSFSEKEMMRRQNTAYMIRLSQSEAAAEARKSVSAKERL